MPVSPLHGVEYGSYVARCDFLMKKIAHRVHENHPGSLPSERLEEPFGPQRQVKACSERMTGDTSKAFREPLGVAIVTTGADLCAAGDRVPGRICPLDSAVVSHGCTRKFVPNQY